MPQTSLRFFLRPLPTRQRRRFGEKEAEFQAEFPALFSGVSSFFTQDFRSSAPGSAGTPVVAPGTFGRAGPDHPPVGPRREPRRARPDYRPTRAGNLGWPAPQSPGARSGVPGQRAASRRRGLRPGSLLHPGPLLAPTLPSGPVRACFSRHAPREARDEVAHRQLRRQVGHHQGRQQCAGRSQGVFIYQAWKPAAGDSLTPLVTSRRAHTLACRTHIPDIDGRANQRVDSRPAIGVLRRR